MRTFGLWPLLLPLVALAGCAVNEEDGLASDPSELGAKALNAQIDIDAGPLPTDNWEKWASNGWDIDGNERTHDSIIGNGWNGLLSAGLFLSESAFNKLTSASLHQSVADPMVREGLRDWPSRILLGYIIKCALPIDESVYVESPGTPNSFQKSQGVKLEEDGWVGWLQGESGIAPQWGTGPCDASCQAWVSACVYSHINADGRHVLISPRTYNPNVGTPTPASSVSMGHLQPTSSELNWFTVAESAFWGNLWERENVPVGFPLPGMPAETVRLPVIRACSSTYALLKDRLCGKDLIPGFDCSKIIVGPCQSGSCSRCTKKDPVTGALSECSTAKEACVISKGKDIAPRTKAVVSIFRAEKCSHKDFSVGAGLARACSMCSYKVSSMYPQCQNSWDGGCIGLTNDVCHGDIRKPGSRRSIGMSDAVNTICATYPSCCTDTWTQECADKAKQILHFSTGSPI